MKYFFLLFFTIIHLIASDIKSPTLELKASGSVVDMIYKNNLLYVATDASCVDIFDYTTKKLTKKIELSQITDFAGDKMDSKVYSIDEIDDKVLILSQDENGFRRVDIYENNSLTHIFTYKDSLPISKAKFLNKENIIFATLGNELFSYNLKSKKYNYDIQVSGGKFSDFTLNEKKDEVVIADESGELKIHSTKDGKLIKKLSGKNLDNVFEVDYKNGKILTAGQDRRMVVYLLKTADAFFITSKFLIYSVALSPSANYAIFSSDEQNNASLVDLSTKTIIGVYGKNRMNISKMLFINEKELLIGSDSDTINIYKIGE